MWALLKIIILCVDSAVEPSTRLGSIPNTELSPQPPARALLAATPHTLTSGLVRDSLHTIPRLHPHTRTR